ncbi:MAG: AbrB/MazE/SpoVT family DNA-binding domain-containing protein [Deltaproteobacteria bacterium]|nr:AbrB/MazE/SpoVT family DNA-binding domain-containing protein [Deltaproteobacteria bacterium]
MPSAAITSKGQITLPKPIRQRLGVGPGDRVAFRERADGVVVVEAETVDLLSLEGSVRPRRRGVSLDAMQAAIRHRAARR